MVRPCSVRIYDNTNKFKICHPFNWHMIDYDIRDFSTFQYTLFTAKNHNFFFNLEIAYLLLTSPLSLLIQHLFVYNLGLLIAIEII